MLAAGTIIGDRYRVLRTLNSGGMATVYEAEHQAIGQRFAIKVLHPHLARKSDLVSRFEDEARMATRINHEHIVAVTDLGRHGDVPYMVMEYLAGESLADKLDREQVLSVPVAMHLLDQILAALEAVHAAGVVHRDLKPANIFLIERAGIPDYVKLLDFGVSKARFESRGKGRAATRSGIVMGTPQYMAPEQALGHRDLDARADVYSAGVLLYEMVTGLLPFDAPGHSEVIVMVATHHPPPVPAGVHRLDLPVPVDQAIATAMRFSREERFQSAGAFRGAIRPWVPALSAFGREVSNPMIAVPERSHSNPASSVEVVDLPETEPPSAPLPTEPFGLVPVRARVSPGEGLPYPSEHSPQSVVAVAEPSPPERSPRPSAQTVPPAALKPRQPSGLAPSLRRGALGPALAGLAAGAILGIVGYGLHGYGRGSSAQGPSEAWRTAVNSTTPAAPQVDVIATPEGATVEIDGRPFPGQRGGALAPGTHQLRITAPGYAPFERTVSLAPGVARERWHFALTPLPPAASPTAPPSGAAVPETRSPEAPAVAAQGVTPPTEPAGDDGHHRRRHRAHHED